MDDFKVFFMTKKILIIVRELFLNYHIELIDFFAGSQMMD